MEQRIIEAREYHSLRARVRALRERLEAILREQEVVARDGAVELIRRAKKLWKDKNHRSTTAWARPLPKVQHLFRLAEEICRPPGGVDDLDPELELEYDEICRELGVESAFGNPDQHAVMAIAEAVARSADASPGGRPDDWPESRPWLTELDPWDPDLFLALVVEPIVAGREPLAGMSRDGLMVVALAALLALDEDRASFELVCDLGDLEPSDREKAGKTMVLDDLIWSGGSPIRRWLLSWRVEDQEEATRAWVLRATTALDQDAADLADAVLEFLVGPRPQWTVWLDAAIRMIAESPEGVMRGDVHRALVDLGYGRSQSAKNKLSEVLRGKKAVPHVDETVELAETRKRRFHALPGWEEKIARLARTAPLATVPKPPESASPF